MFLFSYFLNKKILVCVCLCLFVVIGAKEGN